MKITVHLSIGYPTAMHKEEIDTNDLGFTGKEWKALSEQERCDAVWEYWLDRGVIETWYD